MRMRPDGITVHRGCSILGFALLFFAQGGVCAQNETGLPPELQFERVWQPGPMCGPNALYFLLRLSGRTVNHQELISFLAPPPKGNSLEELQRAAFHWGLQTEVLRTSRRGLANLHLPFIAHVSLPPGDAGHYVLVLSVSDDDLKFIDGTKGIAVSTHPETFYRDWSGYVLSTGTDWSGRLLRLVFYTLLAILLALTGLSLYLRFYGRRLVAAGGTTHASY